MKFKYLVTSGCSFSDNYNMRWPHYLGKLLEIQLYNRGQGSAGNDYISRSCIHELSKIIKYADPSEILCIVMWSGIDRKSAFIKRGNTFDYDSLINDNFGNRNPVNILQSEPNLVAKIGKDSGYLLGSMRCTFQNKNIQRYKAELITKYYNDEFLAIESYEHFLRLQWFCKSNNIRLINLTYMNIMHYPKRKLLDQDAVISMTYEVFENIKHLHYLIDYNQWIFYKKYYGLYEYTVDNSHSFDSDGVHPTIESHNQYVEKFLLPALIEKGVL